MGTCYSSPCFWELNTCIRPHEIFQTFYFGVLSVTIYLRNQHTTYILTKTAFCITLQENRRQKNPLWIFRVLSHVHTLASTTFLKAAATWRTKVRQQKCFCPQWGETVVMIFIKATELLHYKFSVFVLKLNLDIFWSLIN